MFKIALRAGGNHLAPIPQAESAEARLIRASAGRDLLYRRGRTASGRREAQRHKLRERGRMTCRGGG